MNPVCTEIFYGKENTALLKEEKTGKSRCLKIRESRKMPLHILSPTQFWREFRKQADALAVAEERSTASDPLCTFVSQGNNGFRHFIVAHPEVYWWYYEKFPPEKKCTYEVIPEGSPCRLYLDLEYLIQLNPESKGCSMTSIFIDVLCAFLLSYWGLPCNRYNIINLDSSTEEKFSRHLIFAIKDVAFKNNLHAGRFVKGVCNDLEEYIKTSGANHKVLSYFDRGDLEKLFVETKNGGKKLFVDTGVYTRNRHFRVYMSTKWGKNSHLVTAQDSKYIPLEKQVNIDQSIFLDSLTSFFSSKKDLILLEVAEDRQVQTKPYNAADKQIMHREYNSPESEYPELDNYVQKIINPGKIRTTKYFSDSKTLIYETIGYRYCENIGRCHRSNNVFWIVDLRRKVLYQKCHDKDCNGFKSESKPLPAEVSFHIDEDDDDVYLTCAMEMEDIVERSDFFQETS